MMKNPFSKEFIYYGKRMRPFYQIWGLALSDDGTKVMRYYEYYVMESVVAKKSVPKFYVRSKSSTIEAKGEILDEVRELANRVPFDDRGNDKITIDDISGVRVYEYLKAVGSKLVDEFGQKSLIEILDEMDLLVGQIENRQIKNVAAMMFCDNPEKFFPVTHCQSFNSIPLLLTSVGKSVNVLLKKNRKWRFELTGKYCGHVFNISYSRMFRLFSEKRTRRSDGDTLRQENYKETTVIIYN